MVDARCSNPAYALDVDAMILDYLLYNTTKAHLDDFRSGGSSSGSATSLIQVFDTSLSLFKHNHPNYQLPEKTDFSLKLLEFVVLFTRRKDPRTLSTSTISQLQGASQRNIPIRTKWWDDTQVGNSSPYNEIFGSWRGFCQPTTGSTESRKQLHSRASKIILLQDILSNFLDLSASMSVNIVQNVTEQWMHIAAEFMMQSAWEKYAYLATEGDEEPLKVAFAWGWRSPQDWWDELSDLKDEVKLLEYRVIGMFGVDEDDEETMAVVGEWLDWTRIRGQYLSCFSMGLDLDEELGHTYDQSTSQQRRQKWQLQQLKDIAARFPMDAFEGKVVDFLEGLWELEQKPLLVQIEEGKVDGLTSEEFEEFKASVWPAGSG